MSSGRMSAISTGKPAARGAKKSIKVNCTKTKIWNNSPPNRAITPNSRTSRNPIKTCHAVHIRTKSKPT